MAVSRDSFVFTVGLRSAICGELQDDPIQSIIQIQVHYVFSTIINSMLDDHEVIAFTFSNNTTYYFYYYSHPLPPTTHQL